MPRGSDQTMPASISRRRTFAAAAALLGAAALAGPPAGAADKITVAALRFVSSGPLFIAQGRGYFAAEGLDADFKFFDAAQPVAVAIASGDADFGATAFTAGLFNIAGKGVLKVVAAQFSEIKGYEGSALVASPKAHADGLTTPAALKSRSFALTQTGSSFHYMIGGVAKASGVDLATIDLKPLQGVGNMVGALKSSQVDAAILPAFIARPLDKSGDAKIIAWVGDLAPYQGGGLFTSTRNAEQKRDTVARFVRAYQKGVADYRAFFIDKTNTDEAILGFIHKYVYADEPAATAFGKIRAGALFIGKDAALDGADIAQQVDWYKGLGFVDKTVETAKFVDTTFIPPVTPVPKP
jgi:NitT/TauT family transport system substrate-binding protein